MRTNSRTAGTIIASLGVAMSVLLLATCESSLLTEIREAKQAAGETGETYRVQLNQQGGTLGSDYVDVTFGSPMPEADPPTKPGGAVFGGYYTNVKGLGDKYYDDQMVSAADWDKTTAVTLHAEWIYPLGSTGPAGGVVFFDDGEYEHTSDWRYMEAWTADTGWFSWKTINSETLGTSTAIGTGPANTVAMWGELHPAAEVVRNATYGSFTDWFLPSKDELNHIIIHKELIGGFGMNPYYWSSSDANYQDAWLQNTGGNQGYYMKNEAGGVRAARRF